MWGRFPAERDQKRQSFIWASISPTNGPGECQAETGSDPDSLFFGGLSLGNRGFDWLESLFGEVGIELARFRYISNEVLEKRLGILGLNLNGVLKRLCAKQLFEESGTVLERLFRILLD